LARKTAAESSRPMQAPHARHCPRDESRVSKALASSAIVTPLSAPASVMYPG
jgi:hypothetical protein